MNKNDLIELGSCRKPHGIKGAFVFNLYNTKESVLKKSSKIWVIPLSQESSLSTEGQTASIKSISFGNKTICFLNEVPNRNSAEDWVPFSILVSRDAFPETEDGELYLNDLIDCDVVNEEGKSLGRVSGIGSNGVQDILQVSGKKGKFDVLLIDSFVLEIDLESKLITIVEPEYL